MPISVDINVMSSGDWEVIFQTNSGQTESTLNYPGQTMAEKEYFVCLLLLFIFAIVRARQRIRRGSVALGSLIYPWMAEPCVFCQAAL